MSSGSLVPSLSVAVKENVRTPTSVAVGSNRKSPVFTSKSQVASSTALVQAKVTVSRSGSVAVTVTNRSVPTPTTCAGMASIVGGVPGTDSASVVTLPVGELSLVPTAFTARTRK